MSKEISASDVANLRKITGAGLMECKKALIESNGNIEKAKKILKNKGLLVALKKSDRKAEEGAFFIKISDDNKKIAYLRLASETDFVARNENFQNLGALLVDELYQTGVQSFASSVKDGKAKQGIINAIQLLGENIVVLENEVIKTTAQNYLDYYLHTNKKLLAILEISPQPDVKWDSLSEISKKLCMHLAANRIEALSENNIDENIIKEETKMYESIETKTNKKPEIVQKIIAGKLAKFKKDVAMLSQPFLIEPELTVAKWLKQQEEKISARVSLTSFRKLAF